jgi:hypothetical protein
MYLSIYQGGVAIKELYGWDNLIRIDNSYYSDVREFNILAAIGSDPSGQKVEIKQLEDQFEHPDDTYFTIDQYDTGALLVLDGKYVVFANQGSVWGHMESNYNFADVVIDVEAAIAIVPEQGHMEVNIRCREQENYDSYRFLMNEKGQASVIKVTNRNEVTPLMGWTDVEEIKPVGEKNRMQVICTRDMLSYAINGVVVFQGQDDTFQAGNIALGVYTSEASTAEVHFDNVFIGGRK